MSYMHMPLFAVFSKDRVFDPVLQSFAMYTISINTRILSLSLSRHLWYWH